MGLGIPSIQDLNVPSARHRIRDARPGGAHGGSAIGDLRHRGGPAPGYNAAQVLYVKRGYVPDGLGVTYGNRFVREGETLPFDDSLALHFVKELKG